MLCLRIEKSLVSLKNKKASGRRRCPGAFAFCWGFVNMTTKIEHNKKGYRAFNENRSVFCPDILMYLFR